MSLMKFRLIGWTVVMVIVIAMMYVSSQKRKAKQAEPKSSPGIEIEFVPAEERSFDEQVQAVKDGKQENILIELSELKDSDLAKLAGLKNLKILQIDDGLITDDGIKHLASLENLEHLRLRHSPITDAGLAQLAKFPNLRWLNLPHADFTDAGLVELTKLPKLEFLRFSSKNVTDAGIAEIAKYPSLRILHTINVPLTDASIPHIIKMEKLESLYVDGSKLTDDGLGKLFEARGDDLHFHQDQRHHDLDPRKNSHKH
jgi:hypothetical protein